MLLLTVTAS